MTSSHTTEAVHPFGPEWDVVGLPFAPAALNDAGLIVGKRDGEQPVQHQNGKTQVLQPPFDDADFYAAIDVTSLGAILGRTDQRPNPPAVMWWPLPLVIPPAPRGRFLPAAMNKNLVVVGTSDGVEPVIPYNKWTPAGQFTQLHAPHHLHVRTTCATDVNDHGYIAGFVETVSETLGILWTPADVPRVLWGGEPIGGTPHMNNGGDVVAIDSRRIVSIASFDGTVQSFDAIPDPISVGGISDERRLIGLSKVGGAARGWTFYRNHLTWLDPPPGSTAVLVAPTGVDRCGNIVGQLFDKSAKAVGGVLFSKRLPVFQCDGTPLGHP
jgi:hypothetical protein